MSDSASCSHDKDVVEKAVFSNVELTQPPAAQAGKPVLYSTLETIAIDSADRRVAYLAAGRFEAPNWTRDGKAFLFNRDGRIERLAVGSDKPVTIDTGFANRCNNDHGISPDATQLAISDNSQGDHESLVYIVPIAGGTPRRITQKSPSYWHGWSPDGKTLAFVGQRNGDFDIYAIPAAGGEETRLTTAKGLDDGPEYSPDGKYIYFNSERTGHMQIWRMKPDGSEQEQVFSDDLNNWFPHISPDGQWMVFLTYGADVTGHPENKDVMLRLMSLADKKITVLAKLFGGQGTINVPSWSPDSQAVGFRQLPADSARRSHEVERRVRSPKQPQRTRRTQSILGVLRVLCGSDLLLRERVFSSLDHFLRDLLPQFDGIEGLVLCQAAQDRKLGAQHIAVRHRRNHFPRRRLDFLHGL